ncbi:hypothetical protein CCP2SC5_950011 [Azospirillaceae bacterium]
MAFDEQSAEKAIKTKKVERLGTQSLDLSNFILNLMRKTRGASWRITVDQRADTR